jgi:hypothetical protein
MERPSRLFIIGQVRIFPQARKWAEADRRSAEGGKARIEISPHISLANFHESRVAKREFIMLAVIEHCRIGRKPNPEVCCPNPNGAYAKRADPTPDW